MSLTGNSQPIATRGSHVSRAPTHHTLRGGRPGFLNLYGTISSHQTFQRLARGCAWCLARVNWNSSRFPDSKAFFFSLSLSQIVLVEAPELLIQNSEFLNFIKFSEKKTEKYQSLFLRKGLNSRNSSKKIFESKISTYLLRLLDGSKHWRRFRLLQKRSLSL